MFYKICIERERERQRERERDAASETNVTLPPDACT